MLDVRLDGADVAFGNEGFDGGAALAVDVMIYRAEGCVQTCRSVYGRGTFTDWVAD